MTNLWILIVLLTLATGVMIVWPFRRQPDATEGSDDSVRRAANIALYYEHVAEIDRDLNSGRLSPEQHQQLLLEAQRNLLADEQTHNQHASGNRGGKLALAITAVLVLVAGVALYLVRGSAADVYLTERHNTLVAADMADFEREIDPGPARTRELLGLIKERVKARPDNSQYWYLMARYGMALGELDTAEKGLREIYRLHPDDANNTAQLAQLLFLSGNNTITDEIEQLTRRALMSDPQEQTALGLAGIGAYQRGDFSGAISFWERAVSLLPANSDVRQALLSGIARAKTQNGEPATEAEATGWQLPVDISLDAELKLPANATLFVLIREMGAGPMPLLVTRLPVDSLPMSIVMNETMAMTTIERLDQVEQIEVVARVSLSGNATPAPGDLQGVSGPLDMGDLPEAVALVIDQRVPASGQ